MAGYTQSVSRPVTKRRGHPQTNPRSLANLIPYKKGENGHGRVYPLKERLQHALDKPLEEPKAGAPHGDVIVYNTLRGAAELVPVAFRETWDRVEGKLQDTASPMQDNRQINIIVASEETRELMNHAFERLSTAERPKNSPAGETD